MRNVDTKTAPGAPRSSLSLRGLGLRRRFPQLAELYDRAFPPSATFVDLGGFGLFVDPRNEAISDTAIGSGHYEPEETAFFTAIIRPGDRFVDVGANVGYFTCLAARQVGPTGRVYAFEPDRQNFRLLKKSVRANRFSHVTHHHAAVGAETGRIQLFQSLVNGTDHRTYPCTEGPESKEPAVNSGDIRHATSVKCVRLDDLISTPIDVLKIDIQGAETAAFAGMEQLIRRSPGIVIMTEFYPDGLLASGSSPDEFLDLVREYGLQTWSTSGEQLDNRAILDRITAGGYTNLVLARSPVSQLRR